MEFDAELSKQESESFSEVDRGSKLRVSCILLTLNEEADIGDTVQKYKRAIEMTHQFSDYEILLVNDGSSDQTGRKMDEIASLYPEVRVFHNKINIGLGRSYQQYIPECRFEYILLGYGYVPCPAEAISEMFAAVGSKDVILGWIPEQKELNRGMHRQIISEAFIHFLNFLFGFKLNYYNGQGIYRKRDLLNLKLFSKRSGMHAELAVKLLSRGFSYKEVGMAAIKPWRKRVTGSSFKFSNFINVISLIMHLIIVVRPAILRMRWNPVVEK